MGRSSENLSSPWLEEKDWQNGQIYSNARTMWYFSLFFSLFWCAFSFPVAFFAITDIYHGWSIDHLDPVLFVLVFPVVGIGLLFWTYKNYRQWSTFGRLALTLDPYPGSIGGEAGGFLELPMAWRSGYDFEVSVNCIHHTISQSGKNSRHREDIVWKNFAAAEYAPSANGIRLKFKCPIEEGLYESEEKSGRSYYRWVVHIKGQDKMANLSLDREFDIPVFKLDVPKNSHLHVTASVPEVEVEQISDQQVQIKQNVRSLELNYPRSRNASVGRSLLIVALVFLAVTGFLVFETWSEVQEGRSFSFFSAGITGLMSLVFGCVSLLMLGFALYLLSNRLKVVIDSNGITVNSQSLFHHSEKTAQHSEIQSIEKKSNMSSGQGTSAVRYFTLTANLHNHQNLTLGNGIKGQLVAESIMKLINQKLENSSGKSSSVNSANETSVPLDIETAEKAVKYFKMFKIIINTIGFIIMAFFVLQFFSFWDK